MFRAGGYVILLMLLKPIVRASSSASNKFKTVLARRQSFRGQDWRLD
jgi:hypothetical protein